MPLYVQSVFVVRAIMREDQQKKCSGLQGLDAAPALLRRQRSGFIFLQVFATVVSCLHYIFGLEKIFFYT